MKKKLLLLLPLACAGCNAPLVGDGVNHLPAYQRDTNVLRYGDWFIEPGTCEIRATAADYTASSDGLMAGGTLTVKLSFLGPLVRPPAANISGIPSPIRVEGDQKTYSLTLPYNPANAAYMLSPYAYLSIRYEPMLDGQTRETNLATRGLMLALGTLSKTCR